MRQDEILAMMHRNINANQQYTTWTISTPHLVAVVNEAIALEREACAKVCEDIEAQSQGGDDPPPYRYYEAIRARNNT